MTEQTSIEKGREIARWTKEGPHRQGDAYAGAVYFFVSNVVDHQDEGITLLKRAISEARRNAGFGHHIVPTEPMALAQVRTIEKHIRQIPTALKQLKNLLTDVKLTENSTKHFLETLLRQVFQDVLMAASTGPEPKEDSVQEKIADAKILASYFTLLKFQTFKAIHMV